MQKFLLQIQLVFLVLGSFFSVSLHAQVTTEPVFPTSDEPIKIIYDATKGTSGLMGASSIHMHAGVVLSGADGTGWEYVQGNWGNPASVGLMTKVTGEENLWEITLTPRTYFGVPEENRIYRIGMVFRSSGPCGGFEGNGTPCAEGKSDTNQDIFVDLFEPGLSLALVSPIKSELLVDKGEAIQLEASISKSANVTLYVDDEVEDEATNVISYQYTLQVSGTAKRNVKLIATQGAESQEAGFSYLVREEPKIQELPQGIVDGINYLDANTVTLSLYAPNKSYVYLLGDFNGWQMDNAYLMNITPDQDRFWFTLAGLEAGQEYAFQYAVYDAQNNLVKTGDPYAEKILDPWNDSSISEDTYPNLKAYPTGKTTGIVSILQTNQSEYIWKTKRFQRPKKENLVIYELLVRDFDTPKNFQAVIDRLDYLQNLGVNALELMPVTEFSGNNSWGYNPIYYMAVDKAYGTKEKLKELIDKAHQRGMAVILDMVFNQADFECPFVKMYFDNGQPSADNPWLNQQATHPFNVFYDFNHESQATQNFMDRVNKFWLEEFNVDGFRFDLSKGFTQNVTTDVDVWSQYDASRVALLKRMADKVWETDGKAYVILEHLGVDREEIELANYRVEEGKGMLLWGGMHGAYKQLSLGYQDLSDISRILAEKRTFDGQTYLKNHLIGYMESHDEERLMYENLQYGNGTGDYSIKELNTALKRIKSASTFLFLAPGPKMFWQFGELGYDFSINYCEDGNIDEGCRTAPKPIRWDYAENLARKKVYNHFAALLQLKKTLSKFHTDKVSITENNSLVKQMLLTYRRGGRNFWKRKALQLVIIGNFDVVDQTVSLEFPHRGIWFDYLAKGKNSFFRVSSTTTSLTLKPGETRIFINYPLHKFPLFQSSDSGENNSKKMTEQDICIYPNPGKYFVKILFGKYVKYPIKVQVSDFYGEEVKSFELYSPNNQLDISLDLTDLKEGQYLLRFTGQKTSIVKKIVIQK